MTHRSPADLLVLHAVRLKGFADTAAIAARFDLDAARVTEELLDAQARGWTTRSAFADLAGWSLTEAGRRENERRLRDERDETGAGAAVAAVHEHFVPLNAEAAQRFTAWQLGSGEQSTHRLADLAGALLPLEARLTAHLHRFTGYHGRFAAALVHAREDPAWITGMAVDSCHRVWFELHEDLIATLNLTRA